MARITIIQGHPDPAGGHLCHALAEAYAEGAEAGSHQVTRLELASLNVPFLRNKSEFEQGRLPETLGPARDAIVGADHVVIIFPLWLGTMPALLKAFLEQVLRPGIAFAYVEKGLPRKLLKGRSCRLVVTMGMPAFLYRWWYGAHGVKALEHNILDFVGIGPIRRTLFGMVEDVDGRKTARRLQEMRGLGSRAA
jgi:putative NADPH-quinone reductase